MARKLLNAVVGSLFALTFACGTLLAQSRVSDFVKLEPSVGNTPFHEADLGAATVTIFSNLGPSSTDEYNDTDGYCVAGASPTGPECSTDEQWIGLPFTPAKNSHATILEVAVGVFAGTNGFELSLYNDVSGVPGTPLATINVHDAPTFGTCCTLVSANLGSPGVALTAGTQYWVVARSNDTEAPTFTGAWALANDFIAYNPAQVGWFSFPSAPEAGAVKGTVP